MTNKNRLVFCSSLLVLVKVQFLYDKNNCFISRKYLHPYNDIFFSKDKKYSRVLYVSTLEYVLLYSRVTHTHNHNRHASEKHRHHDLPRPPASSGSKFTGKCDRHTSRDRYRSPKHGDAIFLRENNVSFILLPIIL